EGPGISVHGARRRLPLPRHRSLRPRPDRSHTVRLSLSNRLAVVFFAITALAIGALYLYVAPGLQSRLMGEKLTALSTTARSHSGKLAHAVGSSTPLPAVRRPVNQTAATSGDRVTLLSVNDVEG